MVVMGKNCLPYPLRYLHKTLYGVNWIHLRLLNGLDKKIIIQLNYYGILIIVVVMIMVKG